MKLFVRAMAVAGLALATTSCGGGGGSSITGGGTGGGGGGGNTNVSCPTNTVCMLFSPSSSYGTGTGSFSPTSLTVTHGATVTFTNNSGVTHNVVFDSNAPPGGDIGSISSGSQDRTFPTAGNFPFHCTIHAGMNATIVAQ